MINYECNPFSCDCLCTGSVPTSDLVLTWDSKVEFDWSGAGTRCSTVYNVYRFIGTRLPDLNHDGLADFYGSCLYSALVATVASDASVPFPGYAAFYLVTGESTAGESSLGTNSHGITRPNLSHCPTPPPPFP